ncbi:LuxR C-terminal-related transcriptional regulator [Roseateles amylovorans]|uniref:Helix-turn-helix transcriptional regulator n=1 Tax=Roseateles amylovorans TaxID=2978473 RepID=A0ABY6B1F9_9BURK|nr:helix-turn-helix transcriptional regulator [Roseateles amylovorans]UXH79227.1 helix-turn-helix transcriptional regulator [Roseateles amylovorans]
MSKELVASGKLNKQVADELGIAIRTVEVHRARAFTKLGLRSAAELATLLERFELKR